MAGYRERKTKSCERKAKMNRRPMKTKSIIATSVLLLSVSAVQSGPGPGEFALQKDGFIRDWLMLAPIQLEADSNGADAIDKNQIPDEGLLKPKAGDKVTVAGKEFT